jgi:hypothetical protein
MNVLKLSVVAVALSCASANTLAELETRGNVGLQFQLFPNDPQHSADQSSNYSFSSEVEFYTPIGEDGSLTVTPLLRVDQHDNERSHIDLREFVYSHYGDSYEFNVGLGKVFWGVAESENLVDVINQTDFVENDGSSAKLGQPMVNLLLVRDWGDIDLYVLPGFKARTFPGENGRPRTPATLDTNNAIYESKDRSNHVDFAGRVSIAFDQWDIGAHVFHGTARTPQFTFNPVSESVVPYYYQHTQVGLDIQATLESWLLKTEIVHRSGKEITNHASVVSGFEYSFYDIRESGADLGIVTEWLYDERGEDSDQAFQNDLFLGMRLAMNDEQSLEGLLGVITDLDEGGQLITLQGSRRFGDNFKASVQMSIFQNVENDKAFSGLDEEDNLQFEVSYFF